MNVTVLEPLRLSAAPAPPPSPPPSAGSPPAAAPSAPLAPVDSVAKPGDAAAPPPTREQRVAHFVRGLEQAALEHVRYIASVYSGEVIGMTVGSCIFTPLALQLGNIYIMTGGSAILGGLGALAGYYLQQRSGPLEVQAATPAGTTELRGIKRWDAALLGGAVVQGLPSVVYPTIVGATAAEKAMILRALDSMPLGCVTSVSNITVSDRLGDVGAAGVAHPVFSQNLITLDRAEIAIPGWGEEVTIHEVGHTKDFSRGFGPFFSTSHRGGFGTGPFVSDYAATNRFEDFAEMHVAYHRDAAAMQAQFPDKYRVMAEAHQPTLGERLLDRPEVREAGKTVADTIGKVPYLRQGLELAGALIAPLQIHHGSRLMEQGFVEANDDKKFHGKLHMASGLFLALSGAPGAAIATSTLHAALTGAVHSGAMTTQSANKVANKALAVSSGPIGMVGMALGQELKAAGVDLNKANYQPGENTSNVSGGGFLKGLLVTVGGAALGSVAGAAVGTWLGGPAGAAIGHVYGRMGGAVVGLGLYGAVKMLKSQSKVADAMDLTTADKWFLAKLVGGAVLGGTAGTVAGGWGGSLAGAAAGGALAGPAGAAVGGFLGRVSGALVGSYLGGRLGARIGRALDGGDPDAAPAPAPPTP